MKMEKNGEIENKLYSLYFNIAGGQCSKRALNMARRHSSPKESYEAARRKEFPADFDENDKAAFSDLSLGKAYNMLEYCEAKNIEIITYFDKKYPRLLKEITFPPLMLFVKGRLPDTYENPSISVIGTRNCTDGGRLMAAKITYTLSEYGFIVVSGMARGIETYAHKGCMLSKKSPTVAVLANSVESIYPKENEELYNLICSNGAVISEIMPGQNLGKYAFHLRNRIISAITYGTLVVESQISGGSMITVSHAIEQNKMIFAVPGPINLPQSSGTNDLIKKGAGIALCAQDIIDEYNYLFKDKIKTIDRQERKKNILKKKADAEKDKTESLKNLGKDEKKIYVLLEDKPLSPDLLCEKTGLKIFEIVNILQKLELDGYIEAIRGGYYKIKQK